MKKIVLRTLAALVLLAGTLWGLERMSDMDRFQLMGDLVADVDTDEKIIALTFDDGPTDAYTADVLRELEQRDITATFFVNGIAIDLFPDAFRAVMEAGHEIGNHTWSHRLMLLVSPKTVREEINSTDRIIREMGYDAPMHFRPPYGRKFITLPWELWRQDRLTVMWSVAPETFEPGQTAEDITNRVLTETGPGDIVLMHLMHRANGASREALPAVLDGLIERGFRFVTVSELLEYR